MLMRPANGPSPLDIVVATWYSTFKSSMGLFVAVLEVEVFFGGLGEAFCHFDCSLDEGCKVLSVV